MAEVIAIWEPISFPNLAEHGQNLPERGTLSVFTNLAEHGLNWKPISFPYLAEHGQILTEHGSISVFQIMLNMGKSLLNMEPYQFPECC